MNRNGGTGVQETFGVAAFRSRQQVLTLLGALKRIGLPAQIVTTPRDVSLGCGLSVRFELKDYRDVLEVFRRFQQGGLIGFYRVEQTPGGHSVVAPLREGGG